MAFYLSTNGQLHPYQFRYLEGDFEKARLERTAIHQEKYFEQETKAKALDAQKELFAVDVMNAPVFALGPEDLLVKVRDEMKKHSIRHIPIVDKGRIVAMVSDRDLLKVDLAGTFSFLKAKDIMTTVLIVAEEDTTLAHIARVLMEEKISALPVIDKKQHLTGMISRTDILRAVVYNRLVLK